MSTTNFVNGVTLTDAAWCNDVDALVYDVFNAKATAGTSGTIMRSNGTNIVNTTATYPATATANRLLYASGTDVISESGAGLTWNGTTLTADNGTFGTLQANTQLNIGSTDVILVRLAANSLALRNGAADEIFHVGPAAGSMELQSGLSVSLVRNNKTNGSTNYILTGGAGSHFFLTNTSTHQFIISNTAITGAVSLTAHSGTAIPAGGTAGAGLLVSSTANYGVFFGSGAPTLTAAKGSLYLRSDGSGTTDRAYINTNGTTTWTALTTVA